jgi:hypothetical protein
MVGSEKRISPELAETFFEAVREYVRWAFGTPEPTVTVYQHPISMVCRRVEHFTDPLPDEVFNAVCFLVMGATERHLKEELLGTDRTYANAAQCLLKLIEGRQAEWREEWQRTQ